MPWPVFRIVYTSLENRDLHPVRTWIPDAARDAIESRLERLLAVQSAQHAQLDDLAFGREVLRSLARDPRPRVRLTGAGLFARATDEPAAPWAAALRERVAADRGEDFLCAERSRAERALADFAWRPPDAAPATLGRDTLPPRAWPEAARYRDALAWREALAVIDRARPLAPEVLVASPEGFASDLAPAERAALEAWARAQDDAVVRLLASRRPDRGAALLVALARQRAARRSLAEGRLLTVDVLDEDDRRVDVAPEARRRLAADWRDLHEHEWAQWRREPILDERRARRLEALRAHDAELARAVREERDARMPAGPLHPRRAAWVELPIAQRPAALDAVAATLAAVESRWRDALDDAHDYSLLRRNCATELVREVEVALPDPAERRAALGGELAPGEGLSFAPFVLARAVERRLGGERLPVVPSYRNRRIAELRDRDGALRTALREGNTLTSTIYEGDRRDGHFLFFTDRTTWSRPLLGVANIAYAGLRGVAGLLTWPFDGGRELRRGARGVFYSAPELAFVSLRKGRFEYTPDAIGAR